MPVIAMTPELGTGGKDVARGLSDTLGLNLVYRKLVEHHVADRLRVPNSAVHRYLEGSANLLERWRMDKKGIRRCTAEELFELAERGNVLIRGWGAAQLLRGVPHVACIRICAPMEYRVRRLMGRTELMDEFSALKQIKSNDAAHARVVRNLFGLEWENSHLYDLVINGERTSTDEAVALVRHLVKQSSFQETEQTRSKLAELRERARLRFSIRRTLDTHEENLVHHEHMKYHEFPKTREDGDLLL
ncbi:MAG: cytidylate kinase-like family protein [Gammaproteobacteria bacterium]|jgi:cytidylate kinase|nr:cytidylate kinase-like family protein [Gammaproteobacteria bacterium]MDX2462131.1 cytidylate kinase-like family protein [Gammaproteobacteria bacterium]